MFFICHFFSFSFSPFPPFLKDASLARREPPAAPSSSVGSFVIAEDSRVYENPHFVLWNGLSNHFSRGMCFQEFDGICSISFKLSDHKLHCFQIKKETYVCDMA